MLLPAGWAGNKSRASRAPHSSRVFGNLLLPYRLLFFRRQEPAANERASTIILPRQKDRQAAGFPALIADDKTTTSRKCHIKNRPKGLKMTKGSKYVQEQ